MNRSLIVCIGNPLAADDGAGHAVYTALGRGRLPDGAELRFTGLGGIDLLDELAGEDLLIVVDAVQFGALPGTVHVLAWEQLPALDLRPVSGHGIGVREVIEVGRRLYPERMPETIVLIGIEGKCFDQLKEELTAEVAAAVPQAAAAVMDLLLL
jgi:hydrogenase maturation protease